MLGVPSKLRQAFPVSTQAFISWTMEFGHCDQETFHSNGIFKFESSRFFQNPNSIVPKLFESSLLLPFLFKPQKSQRGLLNFYATSTLPTKSTDCFSNCLQKHNQQILRSDLLIISFPGTLNSTASSLRIYLPFLPISLSGLTSVVFLFWGWGCSTTTVPPAAQWMSIQGESCWEQTVSLLTTLITLNLTWIHFNFYNPNRFGQWSAFPIWEVYLLTQKRR